MRSPPPQTRRIAHPIAIAGAVTVGALSLLAVPVAAQQPPDQFPTTGFSLWVDAVVAGVVTLLIGGGFVALTPEYTERTTDRVLETPGETFLYGLGIFVAAVVVMFLLTITIVGILLVVPLVIALVVVGELGYLAAGRSVTDDWGPVLLVAIVVSAFTSGVPIVGGLVGFVLGCMGMGAWFLEYRDDGSDSSGGSDFDTADSWGSGGSSTDGNATGGWGTETTSEATDGTRGTDAEGPGIRAATDTDPDDIDDDIDRDGVTDTDDPDDEWTAGFDDEDRR